LKKIPDRTGSDRQKQENPEQSISRDPEDAPFWE